MASFQATIARHQAMVEQLLSLEKTISCFADHVATTLQQGSTVLLFGNDGSAADAQHLAAEFVVRYHQQRPAFAAIALTTDTSILTAHGNDYDFSTLFNRQIEALARPGDLTIGLSTSGNSHNVINGLTLAKQLGCSTSIWTGQTDNAITEAVDHPIRIPCNETARIQEGHLIIGHWLCEYLDHLSCQR